MLDIAYVSLIRTQQVQNKSWTKSFSCFLSQQWLQSLPILLSFIQARVSLGYRTPIWILLSSGVLLLHNTRNKWAQSSHRNINYISQSPKVAGELRSEGICLETRNSHYPLCPPWSSPGLVEQIHPWLRRKICLYPLFESSGFPIKPDLMHWTQEDERKSNYQHLFYHPFLFLLRIFLVLQG